MKRILIVNNNMHIGGVQKALISLLWNIRDQYDVTLLLFSACGECLRDIPPEIKVLTIKSGYRYLGMTRHDTRTLRDALGRSFYAAITRIFGRKYAVALMGFSQPSLTGYDVAISYLHNAGKNLFYGGCNDFVLKHVLAPKKVAFLHGDYVQCGADTTENNRMYSCFDTIAACSQGCADSILSVNPTLKDRVQVVPNCHRFDKIRSAAPEAAVRMSEDKINIVTVARLGKEKGVERALRIFAQLKGCKHKFHYYVIGDGIQKSLLLQFVEKENLEDCVTMCGMLPNPYGHIKAADLLLIPSYNEAAPLVIGEAVCLGTPVLSMETSSAREMIEQTGFGWVCQNSEEAMRESLTELLHNPSKLYEAKRCLLQRTMNNKTAVSQFAKLIE